jgi:hypothetical protein
MDCSVGAGAGTAYIAPGKHVEGGVGKLASTLQRYPATCFTDFPPPRGRRRALKPLGADRLSCLPGLESYRPAVFAFRVIPIFYSWRGSTWHKSLILLGAG